MAREFDRNMFIMLLAVMIGVVIITYFIGDIVSRSQREELITKYTTEIETIEGKNINFTSNFIQSLGLFDLSREFRADGDFNFELASIWYSSALSEKNITTFETYKTRTNNSCDDAVSNYTYSHDNFFESKNKFSNTKNYTNYDAYLDILDLYVNLSESGAKLSSLRVNASIILRCLNENLTLENGSVGYLTDVSGLLDLYNATIEEYNDELENYTEIEDQIEKEYDIIGFSEVREG